LNFICAFQVLFGAVAGENRGENAMETPRFLQDPFFWMRSDDRKDERVLSRLREENAHTVAATDHLAGLRAALYAELKGHLKESDESAPVPRGAWEYYRRTIEGKGYAVHCRRPRGSAAGTSSGYVRLKAAEARGEGSLAGEEVILDENALAAANTKSSFTSVGLVSPSPSQRLLAYTVDCDGGETYDLVVTRLGNGGGEIDRVPNVDSGAVWGGDDEHLYYLKMDAAHRPFQVWRHTVGTSGATDELLFEEPNELFWVGLDKTLDGKFALISTGSKESSEVHTIDLAAAKAKPVLVAARRPKVRHRIPRESPCVQ